MKYPPEFLDEIRARVTVSSRAGRHVELARNGAEFKGLCPFHEEKTPSFTVADSKRFFHCFGCGAKGDVIDIETKLGGLAFDPAVKLLAGIAGLSLPGPARETPDIGGDRKTTWTPVMPAPEHAPGPAFNHFRLGQPRAHWTYGDADGRTLGYICRFDKPDGSKEIMPFVLCRAPDGRLQWRWQGFPEPRPLYGLDELAVKPDCNVIIVEGEKAADAARILLPGLCVVTWPGGANAIRKVDWSPLAGRKVLIVPDADDPGMTAADGRLDARGFFKRGIAQMLKHSAAGIRVVDPPATAPKGWDLADALAEGWNTEKTRAFMRQNMRDPTPEPLAPEDVPLSDDEADALDRELSWLPQNDTGNAKRLVARHGPDIVYIAKFGWTVWDDQRYRDDEMEVCITLAQKTAEAIRLEAPYLSVVDDPKATEAFREKRKKWASVSGNARANGNMLAMARPMRVQRAAHMDADPWMLNCEDGALNLRSGAMQAHRRDDLMTKLAPVAYDRLAACPAWDAFLCDIFGVNMDADNEGNPAVDMISFLQRAVGYSLTGETSEHCMFILHGAGRNGKSTLLETLSHVLGDYAMNTTADTFMSSDKGTGIPNDIARLKGARFVTAVESTAGRRMNEALVKQATGGDTMTARFLNREFFDFKPQFKLWLGTNHKPDVRGTDRAIWSRLVLIPFTETFYWADDPERPEDAKIIDPGLTEKLKLEAPGILRWAVEGCLEWQNGGLKKPEIVRAAIADYRLEQDIVGEFIESYCNAGESYMGFAGELHKSFVTWAQRNGISELSATAFGRSLRDRGMVSNRSCGQRVWKGIDIKEEFKTQVATLYD